jgi:hypothetical protein
MPERHVEAGEDEAEEVFDVVFPSGDEAAPAPRRLDIPGAVFFLAGNA